MADDNDPSAGRLEQSAVDASVSWVAKAVKGTIVIALERLIGGFDVEDILSHESCHDILVDSSVYGQQMEILAAFGQPPMPRGRLQAKARSLLREGVTASIRTQEGCATFLPSRRLTGIELDAYWASLSPAYREYAESLQWLREKDLPDQAVIALVFGLGRYALGSRFAGAELANSVVFVHALTDPGRNPDGRFVAACQALAPLSDADLVALAEAPSTPDAIADRSNPTAKGEAAYEAAPDGEEWRDFWQELVNEIASAWSTDSDLTPAERKLLVDVQQNATLLAPTPTYTTLKAIVEKTGWRDRPILHHPPIDRLLLYRLATIDVNPLEHDLPGLQIEGKPELPLGRGEAIVEIASRRLPEAIAVLSSSELSEYVRRADADTTICCIDGWYRFEIGDLLTDEPLLRNRPHAVLLQRQSLGTILRRLELAGAIAGDPAANYSVVSSDVVRGLSYFVIRPGSAHYPIVIAPVPFPTANRAKQLLQGDEYRKLGWQYQSPPDFVRSLESMALSLFRVLASFEDVQWPAELDPPSRSDQDPHGRDEDEELDVYNGIITRFDTDPDTSRRDVVARALLDKGARLNVLQRFDEELAAYEELFRRFGNESDLVLRRAVAEALGDAIATLGKLERYAEVLATCDEVVTRFGDASEAELLAEVAIALGHKAVALGRMKRYEEATEVYDETVARFEKASEPVFRAEVARAMVDKGWALGQLERHAKALSVFEQVSDRYLEDVDSRVCEQVAKAQAETATTLGRLKRYEEALDAFDEAEQRFADSAEPLIRRQAAIALVNKGIMLTTLERYYEALDVYNRVSARFYDPSEPALASPVASAFFNKGLILGTLGQHKEEIEAYDEVVARFASASDPELRELVTMARANKAWRLEQTE